MKWRRVAIALVLDAHGGGKSLCIRFPGLLARWSDKWWSRP